MEKPNINDKRLVSIINRLLPTSPEIKKCLPSILSSEQANYLSILTEKYFLLAFLSEQQIARSRNLIDQRYDPFPGLIKPDHSNGPVAIRIPRLSRNFVFTSNTVTNMYSFSVGKDSTFLLENHTQSIDIEVLGLQDYTIDLAYFVIFGIEIGKLNFYDYLDDLVSFSIKHWRAPNELK